LEGTITIGTFFNIPLKLHWSFALLLAYVLFNVVTNDSFAIVGIVAFLFLCVVLHEYGHALMAKRFKVNTKDIILSPIGGVARLERLPEKPAQELVIALAGPAVNLMLASLLLLGLLLMGFDWNTMANPGVVTPDFNDYLVIGLYINVMLFGFNLVPAFPMDGGRVLRSLLALKYGRSKATQIAGWVGRIIALLFIAYGLYNQDYLFAFLGLFIFMMARVEMNEVVVMEKLVNLKVADYCRSQLISYHLGDAMADVIEKAKRDGVVYAVVLDSLGYPAGMITPVQIIRAQAIQELMQPVSVFMDTKLHYIEIHESMKSAYEYMQKHQCGLLLVNNENGQLVSMLDKDAVSRAIGLFS
jgi:Zn-dependent protease/CBS domain-containing protein